MNIASRQSFWNSGVKIVKGAYIRSVDGKLGYAISKASPGFGHYRISWRGSISVGSPAAGNDWTGPMGTIAYLQETSEYFRWYVTDPLIQVNGNTRFGISTQTSIVLIFRRYTAKTEVSNVDGSY